MKKLFFCVILNALLASSCATHGPFYTRNLHGYPVSYGEKRHPGIDFVIPKGEPVVAVSFGKVYYVGDPCPKEKHCGGFLVEIRHGDHFKSNYMHLSKVYVDRNESVKRGQLIGLSGIDNGWYAHLHFGIVKIGGAWRNVFPDL